MTRTHDRRRGLVRRLVVLIVAIASFTGGGLVIAEGAVAEATNIAFTTGSQAVRYGESWGAPISLTDLPCNACPGAALQYSYTGTAKGTGTIPFYQSAPYTGSAQLGDYLLDQGKPLPPGTYRFTLAFVYGATVQGSNSFQLTVAPAPIGTDLRVIPDPGNRDNAVVTVMLTGDYIEAMGGDGGGPPLPAGEWHIVIQDERGKTAFHDDVAQPKEGPPYLSAYWSGVGSGPYAATTSFEFDAASAAFFSVTAAKGTPFVPLAAPTSSASSQPAGSTAAPPAASVPLWTLLVAGLAVLGLLLSALLTARRQRGMTRRDETAEPDPAVDGAGAAESEAIDVTR